MEAIQKRMIWADLIRILSIYFVIIIHLSTLVVGPWKNFGTNSWWTAHVYTSISVVAVPYLAVLSGALLLTKVESAKSFYFKRLTKVALPWIFWILVTFISDMLLFQKIDTTSVFSLQIWWQYVRTAYWFIPVLLQLYILTPVLRYCRTVISAKKFFLLGICIQLLVSVQYSYCTIIDHCNQPMIPLVLQYLGYFMIGSYMPSIRPTKKICGALLFSWLLAVASIIYLTVVISQIQHGVSGKIYHYISLPVAIASITSFVLLKYFFELDSVQRYFSVARIKSISNESYTIFFVHVLLLNFLLDRSHLQFYRLVESYSIVSIPLVSGVIFTICYRCSIFFKKALIVKTII